MVINSPWKGDSSAENNEPDNLAEKKTARVERKALNKEVPWNSDVKVPDLEAGKADDFQQSRTNSPVVRLGPVSTRVEGVPWCDAFKISPWANND